MAVPYLCPVCQGKGFVPAEFYRSIGVETTGTTDTAPQTCKTCNGTGIVWDYTTSYPYVPIIMPNPNPSPNGDSHV